MKTALYAALALAALTTNAFAKDISAAEMLTVLITNASQLTVTNEEGKKTNKNLAEILGQALAVDTGGEVGKQITINSVTGGCEAKDVGRGGVGYYDCGIQINNGDYNVTDKGYEGPILESSTMIRFKAIKNIDGSGKLQLDGKKVSLMIAG